MALAVVKKMSGTKLPVYSDGSKITVATVGLASEC